MPGLSRSSRGVPHLTRGLLVVGLLHAAASAAAAQTPPVRTTAAENFRREPQGQVLARIDEGTQLATVGTSGAWTEAALEGWVWTASLQVTEREGFDLVVSASGGENLRAGPSGAVLARLEEGTLLEELEQQPGWTRVRRTGWIWSSSVDAVETARPDADATRGAPVGASAIGVGVPVAATEGSAATGAGRAGAVPQSAASTPRFLQLGRSTAILAAPAGDTLGIAANGADVEMLGREGSWARVRVEGWAWIPDVEPADAAADEGGAEITPALLLGPGGEAHEGRGVTWALQFISLERAEAVRTDFFEGEPFLLGRYGGADGPFVYVAVPPERVAEVEGLMPLERVTVTGRVRVASSALTGTPIVDLLDIRRGSSR